MQQRIDVRIKIGEKLFSFLTDEQLSKGDNVIIESENGQEFATVERVVDLKKGDEDLPKIVRKANDEDKEKNEKNILKAKEAIKETEILVKKLKLDMNIINAYYTFDGTKVIIEFLSEDRVDFRELIKELVVKLKSKIELRQIGVREQAKIVGGIGICGRVCCCASHLREFEKVSMKMAKVQGLALNPNKISGSCGRLMCCLAYENLFYLEMSQKLPKMNSEVKTPDGLGMVVDQNPLKSSVNVKLSLKDGTVTIKEFTLEQLKKCGYSFEKVNKNLQENDDKDKD